MGAGARITRAGRFSGASGSAIGYAIGGSRSQSRPERVDRFRIEAKPGYAQRMGFGAGGGRSGGQGASPVLSDGERRERQRLSAAGRSGAETLGHDEVMAEPEPGVAGLRPHRFRKARRAGSGGAESARGGQPDLQSAGAGGGVQCRTGLL